MIKNSSVYQEIREALGHTPIIDTHEHLMPEATRISEKTDFFKVFLSHYASSDLISAGMGTEDMRFLRETDGDFNEKADIFTRFWPRMSNTGYSRTLRIAVKDLYGADTIDKTALHAINRAMLEASKPGMYERIMKDKSNIKYCVWDQWYEEQPQKDDFFRISLRLDDIIYINDASDIKNLENKYKTQISRPQDLEEIMEISITGMKQRGITALKSGLAYNRSLLYEPVTTPEATLAMDRINSGRFSHKDAKTLQDYLMNSAAEKAFWHRLPFQIHTGHQEGNSNIIANADPGHLSTLISGHPHTRFALFHGGYPYGGALSSMAKIFPNVYLDMSWVHIISPRYTRHYLLEWLDAVPVSKILGFGGDFIFVEGVYGHLQIALENIAMVLGEMTENGDCHINEAKRYGKMILHDNPAELFEA